MKVDGLRFDGPVARDGYRWWYVDALSDDGRHGLTIIVFLGGVFSPWYAWARRRGPTDPLDHCAVNVALYGETRRWALTERRQSAVRRDETTLRIGPSDLDWDGTTLTIRIAERGAPVPRPLRGTVRVTPGPLNDRAFALDAAGRQRWCPLAAAARVQVAFEAPALGWSGPGYLDTNEGDRPLEADFTDWDWCRAPMPGGGAGIVYDVRRRDGTAQVLALRVDADGQVVDAPPPPSASLPRTRIWRVPRPTRAEGPPRVVRTLEDTPFYARSVLATRLFGQDVTAVHESLSLDRFAALPVQAMLPFRVPRALR